ncbi:hypothetical protein MSAN_00287400 [Mycena sanguinolenta]|uniref:Uncharacterized protein n=1 Tax=Mycena sanguinolenta TaxID=230812 RepID=A0A8H7DH25_9AGAR|nr:hypothetical protein MSAN_00287400 [Mycena sanguinolenta]
MLGFVWRTHAPWVRNSAHPHACSARWPVLRLLLLELESQYRLVQITVTSRPRFVYALHRNLAPLPHSTPLENVGDGFCCRVCGAVELKQYGLGIHAIGYCTICCRWSIPHALPARLEICGDRAPSPATPALCTYASAPYTSGSPPFLSTTDAPPQPRLHAITLHAHPVRLLPRISVSLVWWMRSYTYGRLRLRIRLRRRRGEARYEARLKPNALVVHGEKRTRTRRGLGGARPRRVCVKSGGVIESHALVAVLGARRERSECSTNVSATVGSKTACTFPSASRAQSWTRAARFDSFRLGLHPCTDLPSLDRSMRRARPPPVWDGRLDAPCLPSGRTAVGVDGGVRILSPGSAERAGPSLLPVAWESAPPSGPICTPSSRSRVLRLSCPAFDSQFDAALAVAVDLDLAFHFIPFALMLDSESRFCLLDSRPDFDSLFFPLANPQSTAPFRCPRLSLR